MKINELKAVELMVLAVCGREYPQAHEPRPERVCNEE
jgi:hypothetical protein